MKKFEKYLNTMTKLIMNDLKLYKFLNKYKWEIIENEIYKKFYFQKL